MLSRKFFPRDSEHFGDRFLICFQGRRCALRLLLLQEIPGTPLGMHGTMHSQWGSEDFLQQSGTAGAPKTNPNPKRSPKRTRERPERAAGKLGWRLALAIWRDKPCVQRLRSGVKRLLRLPVGQATFGRRRWTPKAQRQDPNANIWGAKTWTPGHLDLGAKRLTFDR